MMVEMRKEFVVLRFGPSDQIHGDLVDEKMIEPIFQFLERRAYVFQQLGVGCFVKSPVQLSESHLELQLYLQQSGCPMLYKGNLAARSIIVLEKNRPRRTFFPWAALDAVLSDSQYITDAFNRILEHYQQHREDYRLANVDEFAALTSDARYFTLLTPDE